VSSKGGEDGAVTQDVECVFKTVAVAYKRQEENGELAKTPKPFIWDIGKMTTMGVTEMKLDVKRA